MGSTLPVVTTPIVITKVEVYITNQTGSTEQTRSVAAFTDLGEGDTVHVNPALSDFRNKHCHVSMPTSYIRL
jgi:cell surface protein SprA